MKKNWAPNVKQIRHIATICSQCNGCFSLQTLDVEKRSQKGVKAGMICFITIHGVQVLAFETMASTIQDRFKILGYRSSSHSKEIRNKKTYFCWELNHLTS